MGGGVSRVVGELIKLDDLDREVLCIGGWVCARLGCHVVLMLFLFSSAQSAVNSRALIKQTFGDTYSDRQHSGQTKLAGPPLLPHVPVLPAHEYLTET